MAIKVSPKVQIWVALIGFAAVVIGSVIATMGPGDNSNGHSPSPSPSQDVRYAGRVIDKTTDELIKGATVFIDTKGETQRYSTDSNGIYSVTLQPDIKSVYIRVEANRYKVFGSNVYPKSRDQLEDVRLEPLGDSFGINLPEGLKLKNAIEFIAEQDEFGVQYTGKCDPLLMQTLVKSGDYTGKDAGEVIDQLKHRLMSSSTKASYQVTKIPERKVYQIGCTN